MRVGPSPLPLLWLATMPTVAVDRSVAALGLLIDSLPPARLSIQESFKLSSFIATGECSSEGSRTGLPLTVFTASPSLSSGDPVARVVATAADEELGLLVKGANSSR